MPTHHFPVRSLNVSFGPAVPEDADYFYATRKAGMLRHMARIGRIWDESFERNYNGERFRAQLPYLRMIHLDDDRIGFISVRPDDHQHVYLESFCLERAYQARGISEVIIDMILREPQMSGKIFRAEIMKAYPTGKLVEKLGFRLIDDTGELDLYEHSPIRNFRFRPLLSQLPPSPACTS